MNANLRCHILNPSLIFTYSKWIISAQVKIVWTFLCCCNQHCYNVKTIIKSIEISYISNVWILIMRWFISALNSFSVCLPACLPSFLRIHWADALHFEPDWNIYMNCLVCFIENMNYTPVNLQNWWNLLLKYVMIIKSWMLFKWVKMWAFS